MSRRILVLHSRYLSGDLSGENRIVESEVRLLREAGHRVWLMDPTPDVGGPLALAATGANAVWSRAAAAHVRRLVERHRIEVAHAHNLFPALSPAVIRAAADAGAVPLLSLHSYRLLCMAGTLVRDHAPCELCVGRAPLPGVRYRCYRGSRSGSTAMATSLMLHRSTRTFERVHRFLPVSRFVAAMHVRGGLPAGRMRVKPNFAWEGPRRTGPGRHFLYFGRFAPEKGLLPLVRTWSRGERLVLVGAGPEEARLREAAGPGVELRPPIPAAEVPALLTEARAVLLPSIAPEAASMMLLEAAAAGVPAVAASVGGVPEIIRHGESGILVPPGDAGAMLVAAEQLSDAESARLGDGAYRMWAERFTPAHNLARLERAYEEALTG